MTRMRAKKLLPLLQKKLIGLRLTLGVRAATASGAAQLDRLHDRIDQLQIIAQRGSDWFAAGKA